MPAVDSYVVRVWLADRPGALGLAASAIGSVGGEIVGIDILERGGGRAVDELVVDLPGGSPVQDLVRAIESVEGCDVEEVRPVADALHDPRLDALETAAILVGAADCAALLEAVVTHACRVPGAAWAAVVDLGSGQVVEAAGPTPASAWVAAFVEGSRSSARVLAGEAGPDDVIWAPLPAAGLAVVVGRDGVAYRARERRQLSALARIADTRHHELRRAASRAAHPSSRA